MKKLLKKLFILSAALFAVSLIGFNDTNAMSTCSDAPQVYSISTSATSFQEGQPFTLGIMFYNACNHQIKEVLVNGNVYGSNTSLENHVASQGYTSTIIPGGYKGYLVQVPMTYTESMGTSFTITHFVYSEWTGPLPVDHVVTISVNEMESIMSNSDPTDLPGETTVSIRVEYDANGIVVYNENTGESERWEYDAIFYAGLAANAAIDYATFVTNPLPTLITFTRHGINNAQTASSFSEFATDTIYDVIFTNDSLQDVVFNQALENLLQDLQDNDPDYVFPGNYQMVGGELLKGSIDEDGNFVPDPDGDTAGTSQPGDGWWFVDDTTWFGRVILDFHDGMNETFGTDYDYAGWIEWGWNNKGFLLGVTVVVIVLILSFGLWWPILTAFIPMIFTVISTILKMIISILTMGGNNVQRTIEKQQIRKRASS